MKHLAGWAIAAALLCGFPNTQADDPAARSGGEDRKTASARGPTGILTVRLGTYLTIAGKRYDGPPVKLDRKRLLVVDSVNGKALPKPLTISVKNLALPEKERCILKGYESGEMIGLPPAVVKAARELGKKVPPIQAGWQWRPHFVVLIVVAPKHLTLPEDGGPFIRP